MAGVLNEQGDLGGALALYEISLAITIRALGPDHVDVGIISFNMASVAEQRGDTARARELYTETHRVFAAALGPDHQYTLEAAQALARLG